MKEYKMMKWWKVKSILLGSSDSGDNRESIFVDIWMNVAEHQHNDNSDNLMSFVLICVHWSLKATFVAVSSLTWHSQTLLMSERSTEVQNWAFIKCTRIWHWHWTLHRQLAATSSTLARRTYMPGKSILCLDSCGRLSEYAFLHTIVVIFWCFYTSYI